MTHRPLEGIRVADFSWFGAGPIAGQVLAVYGAEVIRVESETKMDSLRTGHPAAMNEDGTFKTGYNVSGYFNNFNAGKLSMQLNLNTEKGQQVAYRLLEECDVFLTNFTPRVIEKWHLGWETLHALNPRLIAAYAPMQGMEGPHRDFLGFGAVLTPVTGISHMSGYPNRTPIGVGTNYPDYVINPGHTVTAILAALRYRNRTGKGQCIELPQIESVAAVLGTAVAEFVINGDNPSRTGNRSPIAAPQGAFRCADDPDVATSPERWIAIACETEAHWAGLCAALPELAGDAHFATFESRKANEDALEARIAELTRDRNVYELLQQLQAQGVPAGLIQNAEDILDKDEHIRARSFYQYLDHPETGLAAYDGPPARLSETPGFHAAPAPLFGEHTFDVCERICGYSTDEIADLMAEGVLY